MFDPYCMCLYAIHFSYLNLSKISKILLPCLLHKDTRVKKVEKTFSLLLHKRNMKISSFFLPFFHFKIDVRVKHLDVRNTKYVTFCLPPQLILGSISFIIRDSSPRMLHRSLLHSAYTNLANFLSTSTLI